MALKIIKFEKLHDDIFRPAAFSSGITGTEKWERFLTRRSTVLRLINLWGPRAGAPTNSYTNGWFKEISPQAQWPGQVMTLKVKNILHVEKSLY